MSHTHHPDLRSNPPRAFGANRHKTIFPEGDERRPATDPRPPVRLDPSQQAVADIIRTTLGPRSMLKMILDASGGARPARSAPRSPPAFGHTGPIAPKQQKLFRDPRSQQELGADPSPIVPASPQSTQVSC